MAKIELLPSPVLRRFVIALLAQILVAGSSLAVVPDSTPPGVAGAFNIGSAQIKLSFTEPVTEASATQPAHYAVTGGASINSVVLSGETNVLLNVSALTYGVRYTVTLNNVQDSATPPNTIQPGSQVSFVAQEFAPETIASPGGGIQRIDSRSFDVTGGGTDIGGTSDKFQFGWQQRSGNFDAQVRVADVTATSSFVHAGLMARGTLDVNSQFAAVFASSTALGCFFESRSNAHVRQDNFMRIST